MMANYIINSLKIYSHYSMKSAKIVMFKNFKALINKRFYHGFRKQDITAACSIDLRSDTFTKPSLGMRNAMKEALVGDDVHQEDETVLELENRMKEITKKDAALFVVSGTMGNLLSILSHCSRRGAEVILGNESHVFLNEQGNISQFGGVHPHTIQTKSDGTMCLEQMESSIREDDFHYPSTELICIENTHGNVGGKVLPLWWVDQVAIFAREKRLPVHVDGARIFNASVASGEPVSRLLRDVNSASICLSKSLGAPIGTVIVGDKYFIEKARRLRKALGGGWRQAGIMAAAGLYSLDHNIDRLKEDHDNAKFVAQGIENMKNSNFSVCINDVHSNIIILHLNSQIISAEEFCNRLMEVSEEEGKIFKETVSVLALPHSESSIRLVTHLDVSRRQAELALNKIKYVIEKLDNHNISAQHAA